MLPGMDLQNLPKTSSSLLLACVSKNHNLEWFQTSRFLTGPIAYHFEFFQKKNEGFLFGPRFLLILGT